MYMDWKPEKDTDSGKILSEFVAQVVFRLLSNMTKGPLTQAIFVAQRNAIFVALK